MDLYEQSTPFTCGVSSFLMILNHFGESDVGREEEFWVWRETVNIPTRAPNIYGMALIALEKGLDVNVVVEEKGYEYPDYRFKGYTKEEIELAQYMSDLYLDELEGEVDVEEKEITVDDVQRYLDDGKILLLRVNAGVFRDSASTSKYLVFTKEGGYRVYDPGDGVSEVSVDEIKESLETLESKKKRVRKLLAFS